MHFGILKGLLLRLKVFCLVSYVIEGQAFSRSYDLAPSPSPPPSPGSKLEQRHTGRLRKRDKLLAGEVEGDGRGAELYDSTKAWSSIQLNTLKVKRLPSIRVIISL